MRQNIPPGAAQERAGRNPSAGALETRYAPLVMKTPRDFFEVNVEPSYQNWRDEPRDESRARALFGFANDMAEGMFIHLEFEKEYGKKGVSKYRDELARTHPDFGLLRDIADGTKHFRLDRASRKISNQGQTGRGALIWDKVGDKFEDAAYTFEEAGDLLITTTDSGEQRSLISIANNVMSMWERLLETSGL